MINRKKILIADSDAISLDFFELMLSNLGFDVEQASDGHAVLEMLRSSGGSLPDLLIIDTVLPRVSGWEILKAVKGDPRTERIPVLLLSEISDVKEIVEAFELGADDYIVKPYNFLVVLARIRTVLRNHVLFSQISMRESRLALAEQFADRLKLEMEAFSAGVNDLILATGGHPEVKAGPHAQVMGLLGDIEKLLESTEAEWKDLKAKEIGVSVLEKPIRGTEGC